MSVGWIIDESRIKVRGQYADDLINLLKKILNALNLSIEDVGLNLEHLNTNESPYYVKAMQILNSANSEQELEYYYGALKQAQKGIEILKSE